MKKIAFVFLAVFFAGIAITSAGNLPDTGQTKCYDGSGEIPCPSVGQDYYGQDGNYVRERSYTSLQGGLIVQDNVTKLMWEVKQNKDGNADYANPHDADNRYRWYDTTDFINALNSANFGGYSDWRMPTIKELDSIVNLGKLDPSIDETFFPNTQSYYYWSSTTYVSNTGSAWFMNFSYGNDLYDRKSSSYHIFVFIS